ncbi:MAG: FHA domain-containing protein [Bifidobacteriaceae bacterium]|nr:FHA domain-containing protein [Bifidobacteriaceae bacterium]MCI1979576.1 FHA domain-containing protein [Bifidobacteriaceae bacterium]
MGSSNMQSQGWIVAVRGTGREYRFYPGDSVVIGRTPLRPSSVADPGDRRLDIDDPQKSMSKRHARLTVLRTGEARIRDLHSTNGTYIVRTDGELMRLPLDEEYAVTASPLRLQLGDVAIELRKNVVLEGEDTGKAAANSGDDLFAHAPKVPLEGVDAPSLSVDEILDVRAGEPTEMFNAQKVRKEVLGEHAEVEAGAGETEHQESDFAKLKHELEQQSQLQREFLSEKETSARAQQHEPAFEPGSVLDRLTKGELNKHEPAVEVDGLNSDDAQSTSDETLQFEMAKHHELLAFLALNPHLYDDLYAWLEAIGDPDITTALHSNAGYLTYREGRK